MINENKFFEYLEQYQLWMERHPDTVKKRREKSKVLIYDMMRYKSSEIEKMTRSEIYDLFQLKGAFSVANHFRYNMNRITDNSAVIGKRVANLLFGKNTLEERWDNFTNKRYEMSRETMSELLCRVYPNECILLNSYAMNAFRILNVTDSPSKASELTGYRYVYLCNCGREMIAMANSNGFYEFENLMDLKYFFRFVTEAQLLFPFTFSRKEQTKLKRENNILAEENNKLSLKVKKMQEMLDAANTLLRSASEGTAALEAQKNALNDALVKAEKNSQLNLEQKADMERRVMMLQEKLGKSTIKLSSLADGLKRYAKLYGLDAGKDMLKSLTYLLREEQVWIHNVEGLENFFIAAEEENRKPLVNIENKERGLVQISEKPEHENRD